MLFLQNFCIYYYFPETYNFEYTVDISSYYKFWKIELNLGINYNSLHL